MCIPIEQRSVSLSNRRMVETFSAMQMLIMLLVLILGGREQAIVSFCLEIWSRIHRGCSIVLHWVRVKLNSWLLLLPHSLRYGHVNWFANLVYSFQVVWNCFVTIKVQRLSLTHLLDTNTPSILIFAWCFLKSCAVTERYLILCSLDQLPILPTPIPKQLPIKSFSHFVTSSRTCLEIIPRSETACLRDSRRWTLSRSASRPPQLPLMSYTVIKCNVVHALIGSGDVVCCSFGGSIVSGKHNSPTLHRKCCSFSSGCHYNIVLLMGMLCLIDAYIYHVY